MDTTKTDLTHLFKQLGLSNKSADIAHFIEVHQLPAETHLTQGPFWRSAQKAFLLEALNEDAQWSEVIDQLDVMLRNKKP